MRMGGKPAQFGFDEERLAEVIAAVRAHRHLRFSGVHMFAGTQILDADVLLGQWRHAVEVARRAADVAGGPVATVDLGGGLGIPYFPHESALDLEAVRAAAAELFATIEGDPALLGTRFILEPGRFLAGPAGVYLCRVLSVKESRGTTFLVLDGGMNHHLAASGNLGQVIKRDYPILNASRPDAGPLAEAVVVGPLCTPLDTLGRKVGMPRTTTSGDLVAILQSGAYGLSASPVGFLSHPMPAEVLVEQGAPRLIRGRGSFLHPIVPLP
jgi:diaminopimelate decarboxylase